MNFTSGGIQSGEMIPNVWNFTASPPSVTNRKKKRRNGHMSDMKCTWKTTHSHVYFAFSTSDCEHEKCLTEVFYAYATFVRVAPGLFFSSATSLIASFMDLYRHSLLFEFSMILTFLNVLLL